MIRKHASSCWLLYPVFFLILGTATLFQKDGKIAPELLEEITADETGSYTAWVYFRDKGPNKFQRMEEVKAGLSLKSVKRRLRQGLDELVDEYDLPAHGPYVEAVEKEAAAIRHVSRWLNAVSVEANGQALQRIAGLPFVRRIEKVKVFAFREPVSPPQLKPEVPSVEAEAHILDYGPSLTQVLQMNVPALHDMGYTGRGVLVCMLDSGFNNLQHEALDHLNILATWDFVNGDPVVSDEAGQMGTGNHGTNTLGAIAGYRPGRLIGPAFGASFILGKTENTEWERHIEEDHWIAGAEWADTLGADIISSSLGYRDQFTSGERNYSSEDLDGNTTIVARGANIAAAKGILIVNSAGNEGASTPPENSLVSPSDSPWVVAVGAVNEQGVREGFSSTGPTADGRIKPDVMAQGSSVYSAGPGAADEYEYVSGTSFSCPLTAGAAALILEINPSWTNQDIMNAIKQTAGRGDNPDNLYGWGVLNALEAAFYPLKSLYPPRNFAIKRLENNYGFFIQYVDRLSWASNPRNGNRVQFYRIYAGRLDNPGQAFELIQETDGATFGLERRALLKNETFLYKIVAVGDAGEESDPDHARQ
jgi:serine protease AprX